MWRFIFYPQRQLEDLVSKHNKVAGFWALHIICFADSSSTLFPIAVSRYL